MRKILIALLLIICTTNCVRAAGYTAPAVPEVGEKYMPQETDSFFDGVLHIIRTAIKQWRPSFTEAAKLCCCALAAAMLLSVVEGFGQITHTAASIAGTVMIGVLLLQPTKSLISLGAQSIKDISEYSKLFIPVITSALAAQGGVQTSAALYFGSTVFCTALTALISKVLIPLVYIYLCISVASGALDHASLANIKQGIKSFLTWLLKTLLYVFTGFLTITGVVGGATDVSALKALKLSISSSVPVIGGILSDSSEAILVGASVVKNTVGIYGMLAILSIWIGPFVRIGIQYLMTKLTALLCGFLGHKQTGTLMQDFSDTMGIILAMTGTVCVLLLVSVVCFMKGMS